MEVVEPPMMFDPTAFAGLAIASALVGLTFTVLLIVLVVLGIRWLLRQDRLQSDERRGEDAALAILRERFARGEIDADEFEERRRRLQG